MKNDILLLASFLIVMALCGIIIIEMTWPYSFLIAALTAFGGGASIAIYQNHKDDNSNTETE